MSITSRWNCEFLIEEMTSPIWSSFMRRGSTAEFISCRVAEFFERASSLWIRLSRPAMSATGEDAAAGRENVSITWAGGGSAAGAKEIEGGSAAGAKEIEDGSETGMTGGSCSAGCEKARGGSRAIPSAAAAEES